MAAKLFTFCLFVVLINQVFGDMKWMVDEHPDPENIDKNLLDLRYLLLGQGNKRL